MSRRRFYAEPRAFLDTQGQVILSEEESRHLRDVLRLRAGDEAHVFDGEGREFACVVADEGRRGDVSRLEVRGPVEPQSPESPLELTLALAMLKGENFDFVLKKATELGVSRLAPVVTMRAIIRPRDESDARRRAERWRRLALEAAKQCGRARVPAIEVPANFAPLVRGKQHADAVRVLFAEQGGAPLGSLSATAGARPSAVVALVGPEGGWADGEVEIAREHGWQVVTLGGRTLRAETAALTVCVLLQNLFGDLK
ncbi:MAG: 16S rRNA (uracil(1498)-N(3))-methyltransferase [Pyrinomonadaceae bacterium]